MQPTISSQSSRKRRSSESLATPYSAPNKAVNVEPIDETMVHPSTDPILDVMKSLGFPVSFSTTHSKHVFGNIAFAVDIKTKRKYRQYVHKKRNANKVEGEVISRH
ncbi:hypothetical protein P9112_002957 [Eukaryota sp. TZLM1-RC]